MEYTITNSQKFQQKIKELDVSGTVTGKGQFDGSVVITTRDYETSACYGLIDLNEFEDEYGFVLGVNSK